jgi:hypothetical protein
MMHRISSERPPLRCCGGPAMPLVPQTVSSRLKCKYLITQYGSATAAQLPECESVRVQISELSNKQQ